MYQIIFWNSRKYNLNYFFPFVIYLEEKQEIYTIGIGNR